MGDAKEGIPSVVADVASLVHEVEGENYHPTQLGLNRNWTTKTGSC